MEEKLKPIMIKPSKTDLEYLEYRRKLRFLESLGKKRRKHKNQQSEARIAREDDALKAHADTDSKKRKTMHNQALKYLKQQKEVARPPAIESIHRAKIIDDFLKFNELQAYWQFISPLLSNPSDRSSWVLHDIVDRPTSLLIFEDTELHDSDSHIFFFPHEFYYPSEVGQNLAGVLYADGLEINDALVIHRYNLPAPLTDSTVNWKIRYNVGAHNPVQTAPWGQVRVVPIVAQSADGSEPSLKEFMEHHAQYYHTAGAYETDGEMGTWSSGGPVVMSGSYSVKAGVNSSIFFGIEMDLWADDGLVKGDAYGYLGIPPGATLYDPSTTPPIWPPRPGVEYKIVADSILDRIEAIIENAKKTLKFCSFVFPNP